ncbi:hypothetical protein BDY21DRAFT_299912 [Lineolata rhizophorae]|uniref:Mitochondrial intermediate peptidase n=1 Tax=Lineolata rhizophorae TaxID=578093 RepID=A0A6A6P6B0_9PEZI|nr:hypothetical protein BDY21DRAFT_299912 [Lineolata rhizophorae]
MLKRLWARQPWTCARCSHLRRQQLHAPRRAFASAASPSAAHQQRLARDSSGVHVPADLSSPSVTHDDRTLRQVFDSADFWRDFSRDAKANALSGKPAGLFQNRYLTHPAGFQDFATVTIHKCRTVLAKVLAASSLDEMRSIPRDLDRISDLLCRAIDLSDFVRATHPDLNIQDAATKCYAMVFEYMNVLNSSEELYKKLIEANDSPDLVRSWTEEERTVAGILLKDFSKSAIDFQDGERDSFVELTNEIATVGSEFAEAGEPETPYLVYKSSKLKGMDPMLIKQLTRWGMVNLPTVGYLSNVALRSVEDPDVRREIYIASRKSSKKSIGLLERLLKKRAELAQKTGFETYAHMALSDKMAGSPEAVHEFLEALISNNHVQVHDEMNDLLELKKGDARFGNFPNQLTAWDKDYYISKLLFSMQSRTSGPDYISSFFSVGTVMQGLSRLFHRLYGIRLVPRETLPGETWNDDVRRLDVVDENEGRIAVVYCDLFSRPGKAANPAHFTLRCSREIPEDEIAEAATATAHPFSEDPTLAATDGMAFAVDRATGTVYQLPTIALICNFSQHSANGSNLSGGRKKPPALLTFREVETLFHEMGHAVHSMLGRTRLQNVSGTRCATDFAELPSVLMEHFASAPEALALYARHWETDAPLPLRLVRERVAMQHRMQAVDTEAQIVISFLDQAYHSRLPLEPGFDSTGTYHEIKNAYSSVPEPAGTSWQGYFGHLYGYGATYYSYLFDRAIAGKMWKDVFQRTEGGAVDRAAGEKFKQEVLRWGGARDGWKCVAGALGDERLAEGGPEAMKEVGKWGVWD